MLPLEYCNFVIPLSNISVIAFKKKKLRVICLFIYRNIYLKRHILVLKWHSMIHP